LFHIAYIALVDYVSDRKARMADFFRKDAKLFIGKQMLANAYSVAFAEAEGAGLETPFSDRITVIDRFL
jgi:hypothetical protein